MQFLIANWKSHKSVGDAVEWMNIFTSFSLSSLNPNLRIIICPPFPLLAPLVNIAQKYLISLGAQDISPFSVGPHTSQVSGENLSGLVKYVIVGHSEQRREGNENEATIKNKIAQARSFSLEPIVCIDANTELDYDTNIIVYEPMSAIGSGTAESYESIYNFKKRLPKEYPFFLYGGSVAENNATNFLNDSLVDGFLVGTDSLDPLSFFAIAKKF